MARASRAAAVYFALVFAAGFLIGPVREFVIAPLTGRFGAVLLEAPIMLTASWFAARWTLRRWPDVAPLRLGALAFGFLAVAEFGGALLLRRMSPGGYFAHLATPEGLLSLALFVGFAAMPHAASQSAPRQ